MISVAMATYNGEVYLRKQLDSILHQSLPVDEIIICDDQSSDGTVDIIQEYIKQYPHIHLYKNEQNLGYKRNFKKALSLCSKEYIFLCDQDDIWDSDKVKEMVAIMNNNPEMEALASSFTFIDEHDQPISIRKKKGFSNNNLYIKEVRPNDIVEVKFDEFLNHNYFQGCSLLITSSLRDGFMKRFSTKLPHDWIINLIASKHGSMYFYNRSLFGYRIHSKNTIGAKDANLTTSEHIKTANEENTRILVCRDGMKVLETIKEVNPTYYEANKERFDAYYQFDKEHIEAIQNRKFFRLLKQNFNPYYRHLKSRKARCMDLLFVLIH